MGIPQELQAFEAELSGLFNTKPPISARRIENVTKSSLQLSKYYKHVVMYVEKILQKCGAPHKLYGLYVMDSICKANKQAGIVSLVQRFEKNFSKTLAAVFKCPDSDRAKVVRVLNLWKKNKIFGPELINPALDAHTGGSDGCQDHKPQVPADAPPAEAGNSAVSMQVVPPPAKKTSASSVFALDDFDYGDGGGTGGPASVPNAERQNPSMETDWSRNIPEQVPRMASAANPLPELGRHVRSGPSVGTNGDRHPADPGPPKEPPTAAYPEHQAPPALHRQQDRQGIAPESQRAREQQPASDLPDPHHQRPTRPQYQHHNQQQSHAGRGGNPSGIDPPAADRTSQSPRAYPDYLPSSMRDRDRTDQREDEFHRRRYSGERGETSPDRPGPRDPRHDSRSGPVRPRGAPAHESQQPSFGGHGQSHNGSRPPLLARPPVPVDSPVRGGGRRSRWDDDGRNVWEAAPDMRRANGPPTRSDPRERMPPRSPIQGGAHAGERMPVASKPSSFPSPVKTHASHSRMAPPGGAGARDNGRARDNEKSQRAPELPEGMLRVLTTTIMVGSIPKYMDGMQMVDMVLDMTEGNVISCQFNKSRSTMWARVCNRPTAEMLMDRLSKEFGSKMRLAWARGKTSVAHSKDSWDPTTGTHLFPVANITPDLMEGFFDGGEVDPATISGPLLDQAVVLATRNNQLAVAVTGRKAVIDS